MKIFTSGNIQGTMVEEADVRHLLKPRSDFAHKGSMGHALLIAGSYGMAGAAILAAKACLRSGVGKVTVHTPLKNNDIMQISVPEAIIHHDSDEEVFTNAVDVSAYNSIGIGPGLGTTEATAEALMSQLRDCTTPAVIDADALNILSAHKTWMQELPEGIIYTPHPKELERLCGESQLNSAIALAKQLRGYIILKGHNSALCMPDGQVVFNSTGNSGMATAGSGDVLTGIITALLARGYSAHDAALLGMYLHGLAGDYAAKKVGKESLIASDIIDNIHNALFPLVRRKRSTKMSND